MKLSTTATLVVVMVGLAACDDTRAPAEAPPPAAVVEAPVAAPATPAEATPSTDVVAAVPAAPNAPVFAALYPGAAVEGQPVLAGGPAGPGGMVTFTTDAPPQEVVTFYRQRAEEAGLSPVMEMNQGEARAYGAVEKDSGASVQVVASPTEASDTSVQLSWSAGE